MATKKPATLAEEKFEKTKFDLFDALNALDKKDYGYYDRLTQEQRNGFVSFMMVHWMSAVKANSGVQQYYVMSTEYNANKFLFNEYVQKHPKLQWLMLCAASPGLGKQYHQWIPHIKDKVSKLKEPAKVKDIKEYYEKIYPKADKQSLAELSEAFVTDQKRKMRLYNLFTNMSISDIETLNQIITDEEITTYEREHGLD